jgi:hypothetical protein
MRVSVTACAAALVGAVALFSPYQAHADVTIIIQTDDRNHAAPYGRDQAYVGPRGPARAYYGAPYGRQEVYVGPGGREQIYGAPYGQQDVYFDPNGSALGYGMRAPVVVYDDRPPAWTREWYAYCASKYRSFDPPSGTFQPYYGPRQLCR